MKGPSMATPLPRAVAREARASAAISCSTPATLAVSEHGGLWARSTPEAIARAARDCSAPMPVGVPGQTISSFARAPSRRTHLCGIQ